MTYHFGTVLVSTVGFNLYLHTPVDQMAGLKIWLKQNDEAEIANLIAEAESIKDNADAVLANVEDEELAFA